MPRDAGRLTAESVAGFSKLRPGTHRHNLVNFFDVDAEARPDGLRLTFTLLAGSYATVLLREVMKAEVGEEGAEAEMGSRD